jgi:hypothetical protein
MENPLGSGVRVEAEGGITGGDYFSGNAVGTSSGRFQRPSMASGFGQ